MHWFLDPIQNHYADFTGRATRQQFWMFILVYIGIYVAVSILENIVGTTLLTMLFSLAVLVPSIAITARRLHDIGKSGWWQLIGFIPLVGLIIMIIWMAQKSDIGANAYGAPVGGTVPPPPQSPTPPQSPQSSAE